MSDLFKISGKEFLRGLLIAFVGALTITIYSAFKQSGFEMSLEQLMQGLEAGVTAGLGYIVATFFTDNKGNTLGMGSK